jgi:hypothetical protein
MLRALAGRVVRSLSHSGQVLPACRAIGLDLRVSSMMDKLALTVHIHSGSEEKGIVLLAFR